MKTPAVLRHAILFLLAIIHVSQRACAAENAVTLATGQTLVVVDGHGSPIDASTIPEDFLKRLRTVRMKAGDPVDDSAGLVVARVKLPAGDTDVHYSSSLVTKHGSGGMHYLNVGNGANPDVVCIRLASKDQPSHLEIRKLNYKPIDIPIPDIDPKTKLIWLGEVYLNLFGKGETEQHLVSGKVVATSGEPINAGEVSLRVNGTQPNQKVPIKAGSVAKPCCGAVRTST